MTADKIAAARALIEPLTGFTPGPWGCCMGDVCANGSDGDDVVLAGVGCSYGARSHQYTLLRKKSPQHAANGKIMAAAPALRDTVAALADLADAQAQLIARQAQRIEAMESALGWIALMPHSEDCSSQFEDEDFPCDCHVGPADAALGETP